MSGLIIIIDAVAYKQLFTNIFKRKINLVRHWPFVLLGGFYLWVCDCLRRPNHPRNDVVAKKKLDP